MDNLFCNAVGLKINVESVVREIIDFMAMQPNRHYTIVVGTDSQLLPSKHADFVSAIVVHRVGNGGKYFWRGFELGMFHTLRDRIIKEVLLSLEVAHDLLTRLKEAGAAYQWDFEIHADVGEHGPTKALIQEVTGMVRAHRFEVKTKPGSYAATNVADRHV